MKFIDLDNLKKFWSQLNLYKQDKLPEGEPGQILTKTQNSVEWANINSYTKTEVDNKLKYKQDTLPNGSADQVLTRYSSGSNAFIWRNAVFQEDFNKSIEDLNERIDEELYVEVFTPNANGYDYVDMGKAGIWATYNIGASKIEEIGNKYAWGEIETKDTFDYDNYKFYIDGDTQNPTKYNSVDKKIILDPQDDVAHVTMGGDWRMPTKKECELLIELCDILYIEDYNNSGICGSLFTLKSDSSKQLFFPYIKGNGHAGEYQIYWTCEIHDEGIEYDDYSGASTFEHYGDFIDMAGLVRLEGCLVRAIIDKSSSDKEPKYITKSEIDDIYEHKLPEGTEGQVLTKTNDGVAWQTIDNINIESDVIFLDLKLANAKDSSDLGKNAELKYNDKTSFDELVDEINDIYRGNSSKSLFLRFNPNFNSEQNFILPVNIKRYEQDEDSPYEYNIEAKWKHTSAFLNENYIISIRFNGDDSNFSISITKDTTIIPDGGKPGQVLTKTENSVEWTNVEYGDNMVLQRIDIDGYNALAATDNLDRNTLYLITAHKTA